MRLCASGLTWLLHWHSCHWFEQKTQSASFNSFLGASRARNAECGDAVKSESQCGEGSHPNQLAEAMLEAGNCRATGTGQSYTLRKKKSKAPQYISLMPACAASNYLTLTPQTWPESSSCTQALARIDVSCLLENMFRTFQLRTHETFCKADAFRDQELRAFRIKIPIKMIYHTDG